jgi:hypothetical protein
MAKLEKLEQLNPREEESVWAHRGSANRLALSKGESKVDLRSGLCMRSERVYFCSSTL